MSDLYVSLAPAPPLRADDPRTILLEFADFQCPFCARFAKEVYPAIQQQFILTGSVRYVFRNLPLVMHPNAARAAVAAECARQDGRFLEMHDLLFSNPKALAADDLRKYARAIGLESDRFDQCVDGPIKHQVVDDIHEAERLGVNSTPAFFVGRIKNDGGVQLLKKINGFAPFETFRTVLNAVLALRDGA